jgi:hypothetical protein
MVCSHPTIVDWQGDCMQEFLMGSNAKHGGCMYNFHSRGRRAYVRAYGCFKSSLRGMRLLSLSHAANEDLIHVQPCAMIPWFEMLDSKMHACAYIGAIFIGEAGRGV